MHFYIYKITNIVNNKIYIGQRKTKNIVVDDDYFGSVLGILGGEADVQLDTRRLGAGHEGVEVGSKGGP